MIEMMIDGGGLGMYQGQSLALCMYFLITFHNNQMFIILLLSNNKLMLGKTELPSVVELVNGD